MTPTTETNRKESDEKRIRGCGVLEAQRTRFEMEGAINNGQWSQEAKMENCPLELDGRTSLARGRFDEVAKSDCHG